ncbi:MAG TPA: DUF2064 domain-containing protein [Candidatus Dormibacteraeota bacterium]|nr:DUF2064 domain-containing protein [Candidatus Dormibacteraeota bacterium]
MADHRLAAVVPAWNEATAIGGVVGGLREAGACCVFVVDAGSVDGTAEAARGAGAIVVHEPRPGYGRACLTGADAAAGHELVGFLDGDGSCDPAELPALERALAGADVALGRRLHVEPGALGWHARTGNRLVSAVLRARTGQTVHDVPPLKLVRADALAALGLDDEGHGWTVQLVGRAMAHPALRVVEVPATFRPRRGGQSKVSGRLGPSVRAARAMLGQARSATRRRGLLVLMAKAPHPGRCKTRLAAEIGPRPAAGFWAACLRDAGDRLRRAAVRTGLDAAAMTPSPEDAAEVRRLTGLPALAQRRAGLGLALLEVSDLPAPFTVAVSADAPSLPLELVLGAVDALRTHDAVLGPGPDGGYYLVGLRRGFSRSARERAYLGAPMGTEGVLEHTRAALSGAVLLPPWPDVDSAEDLRRLARQLEADPGAAPAVAAWLRDHGMGTEEAS